MIVVFRFPQTEIYDILPYYCLRVKKKTLAAGSILHKKFREIDYQFDLFEKRLHEIFVEKSLQ